MSTNRQQKRDQRRRDKEARRRHRQEAEWKRQHPRRADLSTEDLIRQAEQLEAMDRLRQNNMAPLGLAAVLISLLASTDRGRLP